jgi:hypothetical protein
MCQLTFFYQLENVHLLWSLVFLMGLLANHRTNIEWFSQGCIITHTP